MCLDSHLLVIRPDLNSYISTIWLGLLLFHLNSRRVKVKVFLLYRYLQGKAITTLYIQLQDRNAAQLTSEADGEAIGGLLKKSSIF